MPKWASRLYCDLLKVRVERLQDITESDAQHEGWDMSNLDLTKTYDPVTMHAARDWFSSLWDSINADRGYPWSRNNWVWVLELNPEFRD
jgi:hypothetical protein